MGARRRAAAPPEEPLAVAEAIVADPDVVWFPVRHYSPACALQVARVIREVRPKVVLVEGPDDASPLIEHLVDPQTEAPVTILSTYVDAKNRFGQNGRLSSSADAPVRFRAWWPLVRYSPEYAALKVGAEVGAELRFIDAPLPATIPHQHVPRAARSATPDDRHLAENRWFDALARKTRRRTFDAFWDAAFEVGGAALSPTEFARRVLVFAWCARNVSGADPGALEADGTLLREAHMRWHVDAARKAAGGPVVVVTGAFHSVALPWTQARRAAAKPDRYTSTLLCAHSYRALASLYGMNRLPGYGEAVADAMDQGSDRPYDAAAERLVVEIVREARDAGAAASTADAVAALAMARGLASLRGDREVTRDDLVDAVQSTCVKGDVAHAAGPVEAALRRVLVGRRQGRVTPAAGQVPLLADFYAAAKRHHLDVSGVPKTVRLDLHRQEAHREKSAFLHRCDFLDVPVFEPLEAGRRDGSHFRGADLATGEDLHLLGETWGVRWREEVDDHLLELADRGVTVGLVASTVLAEQLPRGRADVAEATRLLLRCSQMLLLDHTSEAIDGVRAAAASDASFDHLVRGLADLVLLHGFRAVLPTAGDPRVAALVGVLHTRACLALPGMRGVDPEHAADALDHLQTLVRVTLTFDAAPLDLGLLVDKVRELAADPEGHPGMRGAGYGVLYGFGATRETTVAHALEGYAAGTAAHARGAGDFLDGLFRTSKGLFLRSPRLLRAVDRVLGSLDWETFKRVLPDLRRAFTRFIPVEIDAIGHRVGRELGLSEPPAAAAPSAETVARGRAADGRVADALAKWAFSATAR